MDVAEKLEQRADEQSSAMQQLIQHSKDSAERFPRLEEVQNSIAQKVDHDVDHRWVEDPSYSRPPNRTILRLGTKAHNATDKVRDTCKGWLESTVAANLWSVSGPDVGTDWTLSFLATPTAAATYASKARASLKLGRGNWRQLVAVDTSGQDGQLFVGEDVPPKVARTQTATKRLVEIFKAEHSTKKISYVKPRYHPHKPIQGIVQVDDVDVCAVKAEAQFELPEIFWAPTASDPHFEIDKNATSAAFVDKMQASGGRSVDSSMWCK